MKKEKRKRQKFQSLIDVDEVLSLIQEKYIDYVKNVKLSICIFAMIDANQFILELCISVLTI